MRNLRAIMRPDRIYRGEVDERPMQIRGLLLTGLFFLAAWTAGAGVARAQQDSTDAPESTEALRASEAEYTPGIEERVVLAGESEGAQDFQAGDSVKGFDASDLEALGAQNIADLAKFTPNLEIVTAGATTPTFFIRGVGLNDFNANSSGAVAIYQDDVPLNAAALQLGTLFDMGGVNVQRGPQGTGPYRNASAGAIKLYARKPSGGYGGFLRSSYGKYDAVDLEGAVEAPIYQDILSARVAFRYQDRKGFGENGCGGAPPFDQREILGPFVENAGFRDSIAIDPDHPATGYERYLAALEALGVDPSRVRNPDLRGGLDPEVSICGELVDRIFVKGGNGTSPIPPGLPTDINNQHNWATRAVLRFLPSLDMDWVLNLHGGRRDEQSRLGQSIGVRGTLCDPEQDIDDCSGQDPTARIENRFGGQDGGEYVNPDARGLLTGFLAAEYEACGAACVGNTQPPIRQRKIARNNAGISTANYLASNFDPLPHRGDYDRVGQTKNDVWGVSLQGNVTLPGDIEFRTVSGYDSYDRFTSVDLDFSPNVLFEIATDDDGWQFTQDLSLGAHPFEDIPLHVSVGAFYLMEEINVAIQNDFGILSVLAVAGRNYTQKIFSAAGYLRAEIEFWDDFTLDGGFRYNWDRKEIDYRLNRAMITLKTNRADEWQAPTGQIRLTYRFREDTHAYWKYTRGWKGGHYNATSSLNEGVTLAQPERIDAFEMGMRGAWFDGRAALGLSLFYYDYEDYQLFVAEDGLGTPEFKVLNASDARVFGAELDLKLQPLPGTYLNANFGWLESEFIDFVQIQLRQQTIGDQAITLRSVIQNSGHRLLNSPQFKLSLTAEQEIQLGRFGKLVGRWDGAWTDDRFFDATSGRGVPNNQDILILPENTIGQKANWIHNLRLAYQPTDRVELAAWVRNLTNENYKTFAFDGTTFRETTIYFVGDPRTYGISLAVHF